MTTFYDDPKDGGEYKYNETLPSAEWNGFIDGIRSIDEITFRQALRFVPVAFGSNPYGLGVNEKAGVVIALTSTSWRAFSLAKPDGAVGSVFEVVPSTTLPGSPTITSDRCASAYGNETTVFVNDTYAYVFPSTLSGATQNTLNTITTTHDIMWSEYSQQFIVIGDGLGSNIEVSPDGVNWVNSDVPDAALGVICFRLGSDVTGKNILISTNTGVGLLYSQDGGQTWSEVVKPINDVFYPQYDEVRNLWVLCEYSNLKIYSSADLVTWTLEYNGGSSIDIPGFLIIGKYWLVSREDVNSTFDGYFNTILVSDDKFQTITTAYMFNLGLHVAGYGRFSKQGKHVTLTGGGVGQIISGALLV